MKNHRFVIALLLSALGCAATPGGNSVGSGSTPAADLPGADSGGGRAGADSGADPADAAGDVAGTAMADAGPVADTGPGADTAQADTAQTDTAQTDTAEPDTAEPDTALPKTWGLQPKPVALPTFTQVVDSTGAEVTQDALLGHYTVVWFYPAAQTSG